MLPGVCVHRWHPKSDSKNDLNFKKISKSTVGKLYRSLKNARIKHNKLPGPIDKVMMEPLSSRE
jgi:hypothetical protein